MTTFRPNNMYLNKKDLYKLTESSFKLSLLYIYCILTESYTTMLILALCMAIKHKYPNIIYAAMGLTLFMPSPYSLFNAMTFTVFVLPFLPLLMKFNYSQTVIMVACVIYNLGTLVPKLLIFVPNLPRGLTFTVLLMIVNNFMNIYLWDLLEDTAKLRIALEKKKS